MAKEVKFNIKLTVDGKEQLVTASADVRNFVEELEKAKSKSSRRRHQRQQPVLPLRLRVRQPCPRRHPEWSWSNVRRCCRYRAGQSGRRHVAHCGRRSWLSDILAPHVRRWLGLAVPVQHAAGGSRSVVSCCSYLCCLNCYCSRLQR